MKRWKPLTLSALPVRFDFDKLRNACHFGFLGCRAWLELSQRYDWCIKMLKRPFEIPSEEELLHKISVATGRVFVDCCCESDRASEQPCPLIDISSVSSIALLIVCLWLVLARAAEIYGSWSKSLLNDTPEDTNLYQTRLGWKDPNGNLAICRRKSQSENYSRLKIYSKTFDWFDSSPCWQSMQRCGYVTMLVSSTTAHQVTRCNFFGHSCPYHVHEWFGITLIKYQIWNACSSCRIDSFYLPVPRL